ncbi:MAG TPA: Lsr2 family protein [Mycobacteriales bacterium]|nr:Lsr2 family protein [Mycobacteriales bacterium]
MAQRVQVLLVCDLHEGDVEGTETVSFSVDGAAYEIDVCTAHGAELRDAFAPFVGAARRAGRSTAPARRGRASRAGGDRDTGAIREWAKKNGHKVSERGRLSATVLSAYDAAH